MAENNFSLSHRDGTFFRKGDTCGVRFERILDHPVPAVWEALTDPDRMAQWLAPATITDGTISLRLTGGAMGGRILQWEENHLLEYEWHNGSVVRYELLGEGAGRCRLVFTHSAVIESQLMGAATGWHYHMDVLELVLAGQAPPKDAPKHWESISRDASGRYKLALQKFDGSRHSTIAMPR
jgi:uncharacterized protein YndB with AHSA1/START domain